MLLSLLALVVRDGHVHSRGGGAARSVRAFHMDGVHSASAGVGAFDPQFHRKIACDFPIG
jgi:hypothetical protein